MGSRLTGVKWPRTLHTRAHQGRPRNGQQQANPMRRAHCGDPADPRCQKQGRYPQAKPVTHARVETGTLPRPLTTIPTNNTEHSDSTIKQPTNHHEQTTLHCRWTNQDATNRHRNGRTDYTKNIRLYDHRQQRDGAHGNLADHEAAKTTAHQPHRSCSRDLTVNRPHASRPTSNQPGVHGSKRELRTLSWPRHDAPRPPTTTPTSTTERRDSSNTQPTNQH